MNMENTGNSENTGKKYGIARSAFCFCAISFVLSIVGMIFMGIFGDAGRMTFPFGLLLGCSISYVIMSFLICKNKIVATIRSVLCCVLFASFMFMFLGMMDGFPQSLFSGECVISLISPIKLFFFLPLVAWLLVDGLFRLWESRKNGTAELSGFIILTLVIIAILTYTIYDIQNLMTN